MILWIPSWCPPMIRHVPVVRLSGRSDWPVDVNMSVCVVDVVEDGWSKLTKCTRIIPPSTLLGSSTLDIMFSFSSTVYRKHFMFVYFSLNSSKMYHKL